MISEAVLLPSSQANAALDTQAPSGTFDARVDGIVEHLWVITGCSTQQAHLPPTNSAFVNSHYSRSMHIDGGSIAWYRVQSTDLLAYSYFTSTHSISLRTEVLKQYIAQGWLTPPSDSKMIVLTVAVTEKGPFWCAWAVDSRSCEPLQLLQFDELHSNLDDVKDAWPVDVLTARSAMVVGTGSIGASCAESLAMYGIRKLVLVDPDRMQQHNLIRHLLAASDVGRHKVSALRDYLSNRFDALNIDAVAIDVVEDADKVRTLLKTVDVVVGATDGVSPRRVLSHLSRRAGVDLVLACVLEDGEIGEVIRFRTDPAQGCLVCHRRHLHENNLLDLEANLDAGYGTGSIHRPMTAVRGDLNMVGGLAAKVAISSLLERAGYAEQQLPGSHAVIGLRPAPGLATPFNVKRAGEVVWHNIGKPYEDCPTCTPV